MRNATSQYQVKLAFIHEHVVQTIGSVVALTARQAQHLWLGGFIAPVDAANRDAAAAIATDASPNIIKAKKANV